MKEFPYPGDGFVCECGERFHLYWNGGELDEQRCKCGRFYYGEHRDVVLVMLEPGETRPGYEDEKGVPDAG